MNLLVHVEQYDVLGILPSQLESLALLCSAMDVKEKGFIDGTVDGVKRSNGFSRYNNIKQFFNEQSGPYIALCPNKGKDVREISIPNNAWILFGPSMGWNGLLDDKELDFIQIPGGILNSRDAVPIAMWEFSRWQVQ
jgi:hypothetical protein